MKNNFNYLQSISTDINIIKREFSHFYEDLFTSEDFHEASSLRDQCGNLIPKKILDSDASILEQPISIEEIEKSISSLNDDKAPGPDGMPVEFYKANNNWISKDLLNIYNE